MKILSLSSKGSLGSGSGLTLVGALGTMTRISRSGPTEAVDKLAISPVALPEATFSSGCSLGEKL